MGQDRRLTSTARTATYDPALYRLVHRGSAGDASFYAALCRKAGAVLELGCGYGRLIPSLLPPAGRYVGLELEPGLLRLARQQRSRLPASAARRVTLVRADMRSFQLRPRFDLIAIPHSGLFCLRSEAAVLRCLRKVREHLREGGELVLDTYAADAFHRDADPHDEAEDRWEWLERVADGGTRHDVYERTRWRREAQRLSVRYRYVPSAGGPVREGRIEHHYLLSAQLLALLAKAGFAVTSRHGDFRGGAFRRHSEALVIRARADG